MMKFTQNEWIKMIVIFFVTITLFGVSEIFAARGPHMPEVTENCIRRAKERRTGSEMRFCIDCCNVNGGHHACMHACHTSIEGNYLSRSGSTGDDDSSDDLYSELSR